MRTISLRTAFLAAGLIVLALRPAYAVTAVEVKSPGGVTAYLSEDHTTPVVAIYFNFAGGTATDPADKQGLRTVDPVFLLDVSVPAVLPERIGARVWLRFDLGYEPIGWQWARRLRQLLLKHFNPLGQA